jgi:hypothetical protein
MTIFADERELDPFEALQILAVDILTAAVDRRPLVPHGLEQVLEFAAHVKFPALTKWFGHELDAIASDKTNDNGKPRWDDLTAYRIVKACVIQLDANDLTHNMTWIGLLVGDGHHRYRTLALKALSVDTASLALHLGKWWEKSMPEDRHALSSIVDRMVQLNTNRTHLLNMLKHKGASWPKDLRPAVNKELQRHKIRPAFRVQTPAG